MPWPSDLEPDDELLAVIDREIERENATLHLIASACCSSGWSRPFAVYTT